MFSDFNTDVARCSFERFDLEDNTISIDRAFTTASWTSKEGYDLYYIWCALSSNLIRGADQSGNTFRDGITNCYNRKKIDHKRSFSSIKCRYGKINHQTQTFDFQMFKLNQTDPNGFENEMRLVRFPNFQMSNIFFTIL